MFSYIGFSINILNKKRIYNYLSSFRLEHKTNCTSLSSKVLELKRSEIEFSFQWYIIKKEQLYIVDMVVSCALWRLMRFLSVGTKLN